MAPIIPKTKQSPSVELSAAMGLDLSVPNEVECEKQKLSFVSTANAVSVQRGMAKAGQKAPEDWRSPKAGATSYGSDGREAFWTAPVL